MFIKWDVFHILKVIQYHYGIWSSKKKVSRFSVGLTVISKLSRARIFAMRVVDPAAVGADVCGINLADGQA